MPSGIELHTQISGLEVVDTLDGLRVSGRIEVVIPRVFIGGRYGVLQISTAILNRQYAMSSDDIAVRQLQSLAASQNSTQEPPTDST
jgi:hypothetical protein